MALQYKRVLLKLSGEVLAGTQKHGIDPEITGSIADEIAAVHAEVNPLPVPIQSILVVPPWFRKASGYWE